MNIPHVESPTALRLAAIQRLYVYLVALISFVATIIAADRLLLVLDQVWLGRVEFQPVYFGPYLRDAVAGRGGVLIVAAPIFLVHWYLAQNRQVQISNRTSALRKLFLYIAMAVSVGYALVYGYQLVSDIGQLALGAPLDLSTVWPSGWLYRLLMLIVAVALQAYFLHIVRHDGDYGHEEGRAGTVRRLYQTLAGLAALGLLIYGVGGLLETAWRSMATANYVVGQGWWRTPVSAGIARVVVGTLLARYNWRRWQAITVHEPTEATTFLRRFFLYMSVVVAAIATLVPAANLLRELLLRIFDPAVGGWSDLINQIAAPLSLIPAGLAAWIWYARHIRREADAFGESAEAAVVRRLYYYAVAATGIVLLWFGASGLIQALLDWLVTARSVRPWAQPLATGLSLLTVGAPIWSYHWRTTQNIARQTTPAGIAERASLPRRIYLYAIALAGALLILFYLARVAYRVLLLLLGDPDAALLSTETAEEIARAAIALLFWLIHIFAIRGDGRFEDEVTLPGHQVAHPDIEQQRQALLVQIAKLESDLATARQALARFGSAQADEQIP